MEIMQNFITEILFCLFRQWKGIFGAVDKTVNLQSMGATDAIAKCLTNMALIAGGVVLVLKADGMKLWLLSVFVYIAVMAHAALKD